MIKINNNIEENVISAILFGPEGYIGFIKNYLALLDVRNQIKVDNKEGYYIKFWRDSAFDTDDFDLINILPNGKLSIRPEGFFTMTDDFLCKLI